MVVLSTFSFNHSVILLSVFAECNSSWSKFHYFTLPLKGCPCRHKKRTLSRIFKRIGRFSNFYWLKVLLNTSPMSSCVSRITDIVDASGWQYELSCFLNSSGAFFQFEQPVERKASSFLEMIVLSCFFSLEKHMLHTTRHLFEDHNATMERIHNNMDWMNVLPDETSILEKQS